MSRLLPRRRWSMFVVTPAMLRRRENGDPQAMSGPAFAYTRRPQRGAPSLWARGPVSDAGGAGPRARGQARGSRPPWCPRTTSTPAAVP